MAELQKNTMLRAVSELLMKHDCVIIPGFGGFVSTAKPSMISEVNHSILPPHKAISFNRQLQNNDGLFINYICLKLSLNYHEAEKKVKELNAELQNTLQEKNLISIPGVGKLRLNFEGKIVFSASSDSNLLLQSFGLKSVYLPVKQMAPELVNQTIVEELVTNSTESEVEKSDKTEKIPVKRKNNAAIFSLAMIVVALVILSQVLILNAKKEHLAFEQLSFTNIIDIVNNNRFPESVNQQDVKLPALIQKEDSLSVNELPRVSEAVTPLQNNEIEKGYYIISGSYKDFNNADKNVKRFKKKGMNARIIPSENGYYRVAVFASTKASDVEQKLNTFRKLYQPKAWILSNT
jgi:nucleoid DNA-binding protein